MTDTKIIRELALIMRETGLARLDITENGSRILLESAHTKPAYEVNTAAENSVTVPVTSDAVSGSGTAVKAPLVGTVYLSPKPGENPFVSIGKAVKSGDVLCTVEAMKMFNEIKAPHDGIVTCVHVRNGQGVAYGEKLFTIDGSTEA